MRKFLVLYVFPYTYIKILEADMPRSDQINKTMFFFLNRRCFFITKLYRKVIATQSIPNQTFLSAVGNSLLHYI